MAEFYDAAVIGGGPAGSTVATLLARAGHRVVVLEREKFPRFHVGESLLPFSLPIFERLGVGQKIRDAGFQEKHGAFFWNERTGGVRPVLFAHARDNRHPMAYQVKRAEFDELLLRHAADSGAEVREEAPVEDVLFEGGRATGVRIRRATASPEELLAKVVIDGSGQEALLSRKLQTRRFDARLKRAALFAHYEGVHWPVGHRPGDILLPIDQEVWYWIIPFSDGSSSVGAVFGAAVAGETESPSLEGRLDLLISRSPRMVNLLLGSRRTSGVVGISDFSASSTSLRGDGYVLVGDAATFLDPVFSTGVFLAMATGERAARAVDRALQKHGRVNARDLKRYEAEANRLFRRFRRFVYAFYDPVFFEAFCAEEPFDAIRAAVTTTLAGGVEEPSLMTRLWTSAMFLGVGFDRLTRRIGLRKAPAGARRRPAA